MKIFWQAVLTSFFITILFLNNYLLNLNGIINYSHGDVYHVYFILKHYYHNFLTGDFSNILTTHMFYGFKNSLLYSEHFFLQSLVGFPIFLITKNIVLTFNILVYLTIMASFFSMFLLAHFFTNRFWPAALASVIFVFNPFIFTAFPDHIDYYSTLWIPLIFLFIEKSLNTASNRNTFFVFLFLTLNLLSVLTHSVFLTVILPIYIVIRIWQTKTNPKTLLNLGTIIGILLLSTTTLAIGYIYITHLPKGQNIWGMDEILSNSPWISDLLFSPPQNMLYGHLRQTFKDLIPQFVLLLGSEDIGRNIAWGIVPTFLIIFGLIIMKKSKLFNLWLTFFLFCLLSLILSFGPRIFFTFHFSIPNIAGLLYQFHPLFSYIRLPQRIAVFTYLFLGLTVALVLSEISSKWQGKQKIFGLVIVLLVLLEYWNKPWIFIQIPDEVKRVYNILEQDRKIQVILEIPMGNLYSNFSLAKSNYVDTKYLLWASTLHNKVLMNGYSGYTPPEYLKRVSYLSINFPTTNKLDQLKKWGVDAIILHKDEFADSKEYERIYTSLETLGVPKTYSNSNSALFDLTK